MDVFTFTCLSSYSCLNCNKFPTLLVSSDPLKYSCNPVKCFFTLLILVFSHLKMLEITSVKDGIPELDEDHILILERATSLDGIVSTTSNSGAAIDPDQDSVTVTVERNENPNGVLQVGCFYVLDNENKDVGLLLSLYCGYLQQIVLQ